MYPQLWDSNHDNGTSQNNGLVIITGIFPLQWEYKHDNRDNHCNGTAIIIRLSLQWNFEYTTELATAI
jgi:predicted secreted Zn-dependent protease